MIRKKHREQGKDNFPLTFVLSRRGRGRSKGKNPPAETGVSREALMQKGFRGFGRALLMELLYRHGGLKQREIGALLGIDTAP